MSKKSRKNSSHINTDKLSLEFSSYLAYLQLMLSLDPGEGNITNPIVNSSLNEVIDFYKTTNAKGLQAKAPILIKKFEPLINRFKELAPLKAPLDIIAKDFNSLCAENRELYSFGIEYGWLDKRMDCSRMGFPKDIPWHTRLGIGHHAGKINIEERFLIHDAFFMLESAEESFANMNNYVEELKKQGKANVSDDINKLSLANSDVAAYSRLCLISFFSFVEAFVNSVGYDFSIRNSDSLSPEKLEMLNGRRKGRLISTEYKVEKFPSIIRADKKSPIIISDIAQIKEPFKTFFEETKLIRDSSVHYSPMKEAIWRKPLEWLENARLTSKLCIDVAREFWKACYPKQNQPHYLEELDYQQHLELARERLKTKNDMAFQLHERQNANQPYFRDSIIGDKNVR
jgi:hypothetical protein